VPVDLESIEIGRRARRIRRRRGLSLEVVAGLAGIGGAPYLSMLERGLRGFNRRGMIEDLAGALGCSVADLTGQPYLPVSRDTADALAAVPGIQVALHNYGPDDVPGTRPRPLDELVAWAQTANDHRDQNRLSLAGRNVGTLITELQVHALTAGLADRNRAVTALVTACAVAGPVTACAGNLDLSATAGRRGYDLASQHGNPGLIGFARWYWAAQLTNLSARDRAWTVLSTGIDEVTSAVRFGSGDTLPAEMVGMMHLMQAFIAAREQRANEANTHLDEAGQIADRIRECNGMRRHFGPTNVRMWRLDVGIELGEGGRAYQEITQAPLDVEALGSRERTSALHPGPGPRAGTGRARPRRRGDPAPGHRGPTGTAAHPDEPDRPGPGDRSGPAGPAPGMGTGLSL
jgi:transcriptional regulator with XRE-family HTH domain